MTYAQLKTLIGAMLTGLIPAATAAGWDPTHPDRDFTYRADPVAITATTAGLRACWIQQGAARLGALATGTGGSHRVQTLQLVACYPANLRWLDETIGTDAGILARWLQDSAHWQDPDLLLIQHQGYTVQAAVAGIVQVYHALQAQYIEPTL